MRIPKKLEKKIQTIKKYRLGLISCRNGLGSAKKEKKKFSYGTVFSQPEVENSQKK